MKLTEVPSGSTFLDVDSIPVVKLPSGDFIAFDEHGTSRPYPNSRKADLEGDELTEDEFRTWVTTGRNRFDRAEGHGGAGGGDAIPAASCLSIQL